MREGESVSPGLTALPIYLNSEFHLRVVMVARRRPAKSKNEVGGSLILQHLVILYIDQSRSDHDCTVMNLLILKASCGLNKQMPINRNKCA